jgi:periplasmic copper chaperone A
MKRMMVLALLALPVFSLPVQADTSVSASKKVEAGKKAAPVSVPVIRDAWISEAPPVAKNNAAYVVLENGSARDALLSVETPAAAKAEMHEMSMAGGIMRMQRLPLINLAPAQKLTFAPGGRHIMLIDMKQPLKAGAKVPLTLVFRKAGRITVAAEVRTPQLDGEASAGTQKSPEPLHHH